jgi:hypothetical protein
MRAVASPWPLSQDEPDSSLRSSRRAGTDSPLGTRLATVSAADLLHGLEFVLESRRPIVKHDLEVVFDVVFPPPDSRVEWHPVARHEPAPDFVAFDPTSAPATAKTNKAATIVQTLCLRNMLIPRLSLSRPPRGGVGGDCETHYILL